MALWTKASLCGKSSLLEQSLSRTPSRLKTSVISVAKNPFNQRNLRLMNYLCAFVISTLVVRALQIHLFMQNKANFPKSQMNVTNVLTADYELIDTWSRGKKQSQTNPNKAKQSQLNPIKANKMPKQTQNEPNTNPISKVLDVLSAVWIFRLNRIEYQIQCSVVCLSDFRC